MPVLRSIRERFARERPLDGLRVGACLHVTAETANLVRTLRRRRRGGRRCARPTRSPRRTTSRRRSCDRHGARCTPSAARTPTTYYRHIAARSSTRARRSRSTTAPTCSPLLHAARTDAAAASSAAPRRRPPALVRLRALEAEGSSRCPVLAVNEARTERAFNDRYGTGQSTLDGILRATNLLLAGRTVVVLGYGWTGQGVALRAQGAGAQVIVCEVDPLRALEARMEGFEVMPALEAAERGDVFITVTGARDVLRRRALRAHAGRRGARQRRATSTSRSTSPALRALAASARAGAPARRAVRRSATAPAQPAGRAAAW